MWLEKWIKHSLCLTTLSIWCKKKKNKAKQDYNLRKTQNALNDYLSQASIHQTISKQLKS